ncbi:protein spinster 1-like [Trifolium pratense]|uniref:Protein spinster 1-like n=1 Tax=Trifolium pratense TaxID=57577 RepID=A0A2K3P478_TRIPR|nr:protein spinster 1-like [Trifolium pratense]
MEPPIISSTMIPTLSWFTPKRLLAIFCVINLLNYLDRGTIASNGVNGSKGTCTEAAATCTSGSGIQGDFNLNNFEDGILSSAFLVGLLVACPIFASLAKRLVGVGEASFISLAAPFIDDNAPTSQKTAWLATFYMCIPSGYALGYVYGGLVGSYFGWRYAFWIESILMLPFAILGFLMKPLQLKGFGSGNLIKVEESKTDASEVQVANASNVRDDSLSLKEEFRDNTSNDQSKSKSATKMFDQFSIFFIDMKELLLDKVYVINVLGNIGYNFVLGAYSYWGPKAVYNIYHMADADLVFGGITVVCGIVGTLAGGFVADFMTNTISNAFKLLSATTFIGAALFFGAFLCRNVNGFLALFSIGELLVFSTLGPVSYVCLHCVKPSLRPLSMAMSTVAIHVFGDVPSSPLFGILQDSINNWRTTSLILTTILFPAAGIWFIGIFVHSVDKFEDDSENQVSNIERSCTIPLLQEKTGETSTSHTQSLEC